MPGRGQTIGRFARRGHAELIAQIVERISEAGDTSSQEITVLARYRDQVATIRSKVEQRPGLTMGTAHALQGGETDAVILGLSACPEHEFLGITSWIPIRTLWGRGCSTCAETGA